jgi:hypothetical protein
VLTTNRHAHGTRKSERLQELDLKYRRGKALRKRGYVAAAMAAIMEDNEITRRTKRPHSVDKDLDRLPSPQTNDNQMQMCRVFTVTIVVIIVTTTPAVLNRTTSRDCCNIGDDADTMVDVG